MEELGSRGAGGEGGDGSESSTTLGGEQTGKAAEQERQRKRKKGEETQGYSQMVILTYGEKLRSSDFCDSWYLVIRVWWFFGHVKVVVELRSTHIWRKVWATKCVRARYGCMSCTIFELSLAWRHRTLPSLHNNRSEVSTECAPLLRAEGGGAIRQTGNQGSGPRSYRLQTTGDHTPEHAPSRHLRS